jgi:7,8-dihydroneopterin aldolase/epimerase/oxygenase
MAVDTVFVRDLEIDAVIGAYDWEREVLQRLVVSLEMSTQASVPGRSDDLEDVWVDYAKVASGVRELITERKFHLIETAAESIARMITEGFPVEWVKVSIAKPRPDDGFTAGIVIERRRP